MTLTVPGFFRTMQFLGLLGSTLALLASPFMALYDVVFVIASSIAVCLDIGGIRTRWVGQAALAALVKVVVLMLATSVLLMGGPTYLASIAPLVDPDVAPRLLLYSCVPSVVGAFGRWLTR